VLAAPGKDWAVQAHVLSASPILSFASFAVDWGMQPIQEKR
jgi:hypothetical protein